MPSQKNIQSVADIKTKLSGAKSAALFQYQGLNAAGIANLRQAVKDQGGHIEVFKNTLITRALSGLQIKLEKPLTGPTAIAFAGQDEIAPLKEVEKVSKDKDVIQFKLGWYEQKLLSATDLGKLLSLPSKTQLIGNLLGGLQNPLLRLTQSFRYHQTRLAIALKAASQKAN